MVVINKVVRFSDKEKMILSILRTIVSKNNKYAIITGAVGLLGQIILITLLEAKFNLIQ